MQISSFDILRMYWLREQKKYQALAREERRENRVLFVQLAAYAARQAEKMRAAQS